jgi:hypothetical protein
MPGVAQVTQGGPKTFTPADNAFVRGGRLVETVTTGGAGFTGRIQEAGAASVKVIGIALNDAIAPEDVSTAPTTDAQGRLVTPMYSLPTTVSVAYGGSEVIGVYSANANFGDKLVATANGTVAPAGATPDARTVVGICTEPLGVVFATNPNGLVRTA